MGRWSPPGSRLRSPLARRASSSGPLTPGSREQRAEPNVVWGRMWWGCVTESSQLHSSAPPSCSTLISHGWHHVLCTHLIKLFSSFMQLQTCLSLIHDLSKPQGCVFVPGKVLRNHKKKPARRGEWRDMGSTWSKNNLRQLFLLNSLLVNTWDWLRHKPGKFDIKWRQWCNDDAWGQCATRLILKGP